MLTNLLLSSESSSESVPANNSWWIYLVLIALVVVMLVLPSITNRRRVKEYNQMVDRLRVGDEVRTIGGIIGRVTKINLKNDVPTFVMETGAKGSKTTMEFDMNAVGTVLKSNYVEPVQNDKKSDKKDEKANEEQVQEEVKAEEVVEVKEEKPVAKKKAPSKKKTTSTKKQ